MSNDRTGPFPAPGRRDGEAPCRECHLKPGETCDICGAVAKITEPTYEDAIAAWNRRAALTINPEDAGRVERVARAHDPIGWEWHDKYKDDEDWAANIEMFRAEKLSKARAVLKALLDA